MSEDDVLSDTFRFADVAFRKFAEMTAANDGAPFEEAHTATWKLYELGHLKLVGEGDRLNVRACITREERRAVANRTAHWPPTGGGQYSRRAGAERNESGRPLLLQKRRWITWLLVTTSRAPETPFHIGPAEEIPMPAKYPGLRALLRPCMDGVAAPFSDEGESVVSMRFHVAVQTALTEHLVGLSEGQSVSDSLIDEIIECAFSGLYNNVLLQADDR